MCSYPQFSFWISVSLAKICFFRSHKLRKNTSVLVGTIVKISTRDGLWFGYMYLNHREKIYVTWYMSINLTKNLFLFLKALQLEKKQLTQQWYSSLIGMRRRDEAFAAMQEALRWVI